MRPTPVGNSSEQSGAAETIKPNDTVGFKDGTNIAITNNGEDITIAPKT